MITEARGNLLAADVEALVNTVNTVGVMGKGIALQFKRAYPAMFKDYAAAARRGELALGRMHVWETGLMTGPRFIINFPTKSHWKARSRLGDISDGLDALVVTVRDLGIRSVAVPPLGCGQGGLRWSEVEPLIREKLAALDHVDVVVFPPTGAPPPAEMVSLGDAPKLTPGRAALIRVMAAYSIHALDWPTQIEAQKLVYFLQMAGEPLNLEFTPGYYGPYADTLRKVLRDLEGHYISGFGDGSDPVLTASPLEVLPGAREAAGSVIAHHDETAHRIERVLELVAGFESSYGLELLATVHWLLDHEPDLADDPPRLVEGVQTWTARKQRIFDRNHIVIAADALHERGWRRTLATA